jgi:hypothetical protein
VRADWGNPTQQRFADDTQRRLDKVDRKGRMRSHVVTDLEVTYDAKTNSAQIDFAIASLEGLDSIILLRNFSRDPGSAKTLNAWSRDSLNALDSNLYGFSYSDADPALLGQKAYYWVRVVPQSSPKATSYLVGPQLLDQSFQATGTPGEAADFDASHAAGANGAVLVSVAIEPPTDGSFSSLKIYAKNYEGNAASVAVAQQNRTSFSFFMFQTGELVTLYAVVVSVAGVESPLAAAPSKNLTLNGAATVPAKPMNVTASELTTGVQVGWPASPEATVTKYLVYRGARGGGFGASAQIGFVNSSGANSYTFLDTAGLGGQYEWYIIAQNPTGNSPASAAATTISFATSADLPPNSPNNTTNFATVDSIDAGANASIRVYGTGGVGTTWTRQTGYGTETYPAATLTGFNYTTLYFVLYNKLTGTYSVVTSLPQAMADNFVWAGKVTTVAAGGAGGTIGGGGSTGNDGGRLEIA